MTGLPLAAVHKAIDSRLIRPRTARSGATVRRLLTKEQLIFLQLEAENLRLLPVGTRREIAEAIQRPPNTEKLRVANGTALLIEIGSARRRMHEARGEPADFDPLAGDRRHGAEVRRPAAHSRA